MKHSILKKMALLLTGATAFATPSFGYTAGDIPGTTGSGTEADPVVVNSYSELKAALEHADITHVELGDVSGENGTVIVEGDGVINAISVEGSKHLTVSGQATFTPGIESNTLQSFIAMTNLSDNLTLDGEGSLTYNVITSDNFFLFWVGHGNFVVESGSYKVTSTNYAYGAGAVLQCGYVGDSYCEINGGAFTSVSNVEAAIGYHDHVVYIQRGHFKITGGTFTRSGSRVTRGRAALAVNTAYAEGEVLGGSFNSVQYSISSVSTVVGGAKPLSSFVKAGAFDGENVSLAKSGLYYDQNVEVKFPSVSIPATNGGSAEVDYMEENTLKFKALPSADNFVFTGWQDADSKDTLSKATTFDYDLSTNPSVLATFADVDTLTVWNDTIYRIDVSSPIPSTGADVFVPTSITEGTVSLLESPYSARWVVCDGNTSDWGTCRLQWYSDMTAFPDENLWVAQFYIAVQDGKSLKYSSSHKPKIFWNGEELGECFSLADETHAFVRIPFENKRFKVELTAVLAGGSPIMVTTPTSCIKATPYVLEDLTLNKRVFSPEDIHDYPVVEGNQYAIYLNVSLDEETASCADDEYVMMVKNLASPAKVYVNGTQFRSAAVLSESNGFHTTDAILFDYASAPITREITFYDKDGITVLQQSNISIGTMPVPPVAKADNETFHYFAKWAPEIAAVTEDAEYTLVSVDSVLKDRNIYLTVEAYAGEHVKVSTPSSCILAYPYAIISRALDMFEYGGVNNDVSSLVTLSNGYEYLFSLKTSIDVESPECQNDIYVKTMLYYEEDAEIHINGEYARAELEASTHESTGANILLTVSLRTSYGAITIAADRSTATIDGKSNIAVADMNDVEVSGDVTLNRSYVAGKYSTIMLPFATNASNITGVSFYGLHDVVKKDDDWQVQVSPVSEILANTPYIVVCSGDASNLVVTGGVTFNTTEGTKSSTAGDWQFVGTYEYKKWTEGDPELGRAFVIDEVGNLKKIEVGDELYPLSAYLVFDGDVFDIPYTVTFFDDKGVQVGDVVTVASGMAVGAPAEPAKREGYTFAGWFQKDAETAYDFSAAVNQDLELYGKWTVNKYEIAVVVNDSKMGSVKGAGEYEYGTEVELVATAAEGYKFSNWEDDAKASATRKVVVKADAEYTANFSVISSSSSVIPSVVEGSSSSEIATNSSSSRNDTEKSSSSSAKQSSSSAKPASSSSEIATNSSSSRNDSEKSSSSSAKPNSSSSVKSSSSGKTDAIFAATQAPKFSLSVAGRNIQIAGARIGSAYAVLDMQGRVMTIGSVESANFSVALPRSGSYMVRVGSQTQRVNVR